MQKLEISVRRSQKWNQVQTKSVRPPSSPSYPRLLSVNCWILKKNLDCCCQLSVSWQEQRTYLGREEGVDDEDKRLQRKRLIIVATKRESQINIALSFAFNWQFSPNYFWKEGTDKNPIYAIKISFAWCIQESVAWLKIHWSSIFSKANWFLSQVSPNIPTSQMVADRWQRLHAANSFPNYFEKCYKWFFNICLNQLSWF